MGNQIEANIPKFFHWNNEPSDEYPVETIIPEPTLQQLLTQKANDESLRDGIQGAPLHPTVEQKIDYIKRSSEMGTDYLTVGIYSGKDVNEDTYRVLDYMAENTPDTFPIVLARPKEEDLQYASECVSHNPNCQVIVFQGLSEPRLWIQGWKAEQVLKNLHEGISELTKQNIFTIAFTEDTTRTSPELIGEYVRMAVESGASRIGIADTVGYLTRKGAYRLTKTIRDLLDVHGENGQRMGIDIHAHNDQGIPLEVVFGAISGGADRFHGTLYGVGERAGNAPLEVILYNITRELNEAGYNKQWDLSKIYDLAKYYSRISGVAIPTHAPLVGDNVFTTQAGIHSDAEMKANNIRRSIPDNLANKELRKKINEILNTIYTSVDSNLLGREHEYKIGPLSGKSTAILSLERMGYEDVTDEMIQSILNLARVHGGVLTNDDIQGTLGKPPHKK